MANIKKLEDTMTFIRDHPERHDQGTFGVMPLESDCGTSHCFAGWVSVLEGDEQVWGGRYSYDQGVVYLQGVIPHDRPFDNVSSFARGRELLGLNDFEAEMLFYQAQNRDQVEAVVKGIANGETARAIHEAVVASHDEDSIDHSCEYCWESDGFAGSACTPFPDEV